MYKSFFISLILLIELSCSPIFAQDNHSIQLNGGIISPRSSSNGLSTFLQYNYSLNSTFSFYFSAGYSSWDKFYVTYIVELTSTQKQQFFQTYSSDNHVLIPLYAGTKINFHTNKLFTTFVNFEIGYSYFSYSSYENYKVEDPVTGEVLSYQADRSTKKEINENLFGIGAGAGLSLPFTKSFNLVLSVKVNSNFNTGEFGFFSAKGTFINFLAGLEFKI